METTKEKDVLGLQEELQGRIDQPNYSWQPDTVFTLTGRQFEILAGVLNEYMSQPKNQEVLAIAQLWQISQEVMQKGIADGSVIQEGVSAD